MDHDGAYHGLDLIKKPITQTNKGKIKINNNINQDETSRTKSDP